MPAEVREAKPPKVPTGFVAIDIETANADLASICQVGIAHFSNSVLIREWKSYIDPQDYFDGINVSIHGIDEALVAGAPTFGAVSKILSDALDGHVVVTHTTFDRAAIYQAATRCGVASPSCIWLDSARVARRTWQQFSRRGYGLQNVCDFIGYKFKAHDALEDAKAAGNILISAMAETGLDLGSLVIRASLPIAPALQQKISCDGNPDGELFGEVLVFTGALNTPRREAAGLAARAGCEVDAGVTKRTTILVVGDQDIRRLAGHKKSTKHRKVEELIKHGQDIRILRETDFNALVENERAL